MTPEARPPDREEARRAVGRAADHMFAITQLRMALPLGPPV